MRLTRKVIGHGPSHLVILPGLLGQAKNWNHLQRALLKQLGSQWTVHALDMRNHGSSPHSAVHSIALMTEDCEAYCRAECPVRPASFFSFFFLACLPWWPPQLLTHAHTLY